MRLISDKAKDYINKMWNNLQLDLTNRCNTKCVHCVGHFVDRSIGDIPIENIKQCIDDFKKYSTNPYSIILNCNAEPTCSNNFEEILKYIDTKFDSIIVYYDTNCIKCTDTLIETLKNIKNITVKVSISSWGYNIDTFKKYHDVVNYEKQFLDYDKNVEKYLSINSKNIKISFSTPCIDEEFVINELKYLNNKVNKFGYAIKQLQDGMKFTNNMDEIPLLVRVFYNESVPYWNNVQLPREYKKDNGCELAYSIVNITNDGRVFPCVTVNRYNEYCLGNIKENTLWDILYKNKSYEFLSKLVVGELPFEKCKKCTAQYCDSKMINKLGLKAEFSI